MIKAWEARKHRLFWAPPHCSPTPALQCSVHCHLLPAPSLILSLAARLYLIPPSQESLLICDCIRPFFIRTTVTPELFRHTASPSLSTPKIISKITCTQPENGAHRATKNLYQQFLTYLLASYKKEPVALLFPLLILPRRKTPFLMCGISTTHSNQHIEDMGF